MIPLYTIEQFNQCKSREKLPLKCKHCSITFYKTKHDIQLALNPNSHTTFDLCSPKCVGSYQTSIGTTTIKCNQCNLDFNIQNSQLKNSTNHFCSKSCAGTFNNTHKTIGNRRSKLEVQLETKLPTLYPDLEIHFNHKDAIESELDIYIPSIKLAFELNGIFHYEPIFGDNKLNQIQNNDTNKFMKCQEKQISLCIIDVSKQTYFKEQTSIKYLNIITNIINQHLANQ